MQRHKLTQYTLLAATCVAASAASPSRVSAADSSQDPGAVPDARLTAPLAVPAGGVKLAFLISQGAEVVDFAGTVGRVRVRVDRGGPPRAPSSYTPSAPPKARSKSRAE